MPLSSRIPAMVSSALFVCVIQYAPGAWANVGGTVVISDQTDCSDCHQSAACGWDGMPDLSPSNGGGGIGGDGGGGSDGGRSEAPAKRTAQQKAAEQAKCDAQKNDDLTDARLKYTQSMGVCASKNSSWPGMLYQQWLELSATLDLRYENGTITIGGVGMDCASTSGRAFDNAKWGINLKYDFCSAKAQKD